MFTSFWVVLILGMKLISEGVHPILYHQLLTLDACLHRILCVVLSLEMLSVSYDSHVVLDSDLLL